ncbi:unnamed protein product, partial [marine sediment metagenome]
MPDELDVAPEPDETADTLTPEEMESLSTLPSDTPEADALTLDMPLGDDAEAD